MEEIIKILGFAGSLRKASYNRSALRAAVKLVPPEAQLDTIELDNIPLYNGDHESELPQAVLSFKAAIKAADAILIVTPEYNNPVPGVLKNALDWASRQLTTHKIRELLEALIEWTKVLQKAKPALVEA